MKYRVEMLDTATEDAREYAHYILSRESDPEPALIWLDGLKAVVDSLKSMPQRYPKLRESEVSEHEYRGFMYGSHRVIYRVDEAAETVYVLRIWHGARRELKPDNL